jgi:hypothetical protein
MMGIPIDLGEFLLIMLVIYLVGFVMGRWTKRDKE